MTKNTANGEKISPDEALNIAKIHFDHALVALEDSLQKERSAEPDDGSKTAQARLNFRRSMQVLFDERTRVEQFSKNASGVTHDYTIDLDKARDEIWRRLSCLRDKGDAGGVPAQPE